MIKIKKLLLILFLTFIIINIVSCSHNNKNKKNQIPKEEIEEIPQGEELRPIQDEVENKIINERLDNDNVGNNNERKLNKKKKNKKNKKHSNNEDEEYEKELEERLEQLEQQEQQLEKQYQQQQQQKGKEKKYQKQPRQFNSKQYKSRKYVEHNSRIIVNEKVWKVMQIENSVEAKIELTFGIRQRNLDELEEFVWQVSNPDHPNYGSYKSFSEIKEMVKPLEESIPKVKDWLSENDILDSYITESGDFVRVTTSVRKAEQLLSVRYNKLVHKESKKSFYRSLDPYSVPSDLLEHIDFIGGVNHLPILSSKSAQQSELLKSNKVPLNYNFDKQGKSSKDRDPLLSPALIRKEMNVSQVSTNSTHLGNSQAIAQFLKEYFSPADLKNFQSRFSLPDQEVVNVVGPNERLSPGLETALDIQYIMAMAPNVPTWIVSTGGLHEGQEPFLDWLVDLSSNKNLPLVHSISYGDEEASIQKAYTDRVDTEFKKYAAMGRTIVFSSGDFGAGCWPASSRFVLAVGGVIKKSDGSIIGDSISGGGFSNYFERPTYQDSECSDYIESLNGSLSEYYSQAENVVILYKNRLLPIGGTSASAPIIAGLLSLINDQRLQNNKPSIGLFNPLLYKIAREFPNSFLDIDYGENSYKCCANGFKATKGWDPVTGLGVPNFDELIKHCV
ncbi:hypothetical protein DICPUDRAFT_148281 [Dictyostelium purpureum]|uniref:Peptidase S53 domain-containing protein n=1 Tax=Dictyostelium purpureum TaxID=5786 RepID=F0ZAQ0_DICPU|nr:uncharacterized protein DICPUDRAFT_148281 [Dictyostelium purpureum]EGC38959.1 hypothetical protein DICPUDRAFT_148281 [Dictyostelium purpureum]|eukprot:XP_003284524.1 hypothetical protein DICPUDRAFT_148281 [Dictyostelium purpureum]